MLRYVKGGLRVVYTVGSKFRSAALDVTLKAPRLEDSSVPAYFFLSIILGRPNSLASLFATAPLIISGKWCLENTKTPLRLAEEELRRTEGLEGDNWQAERGRTLSGSDIR